MNHKKMETCFRKNRISAVAVFLAVTVAFVFSGCASAAMKYEIPFGTEADVDSFTVSSVKTGEGEFRIVVTSSASVESELDVKMWRTEIGHDYSGKYSSDNDASIDAKFQVDGGRTVIAAGMTNEISVLLTNAYHVSRYFRTRVSIYIKGDESKLKITIPIEDSDILSDVRYLRQLNRVDYWHPKMLSENWNKYLAHVGE